ncbi:MAG: DNA replication protein [Alphaproteobacteria bacterium]|nr:DNA replication protein [Alphaproteobacteria bacterium]
MSDDKNRPVSRDEKGPLTWLHQRRDKNGQPLISKEELEAGNRLATDFHVAMLNPRVTASWSGQASSRRERRGPPGYAQNMPDRAIAARQRFESALRAVGREQANLLIDVCCFERGLTEIEKAAGWPQRSGKLVLQFALRELARHYGIVRDEHPASEGTGRIRHWGAADYRPKP